MKKASDTKVENKGGGLLASRREIDAIDRKLLALFERRMEISKNIALYKKDNGLEIFDPKREEEKLKEIAAAGRLDFSEYNMAFFSALMDLSKAYQKDILSK